MYKYNNAKVAKDSAEEKNLSYGMSIFDGKWYVGTPEELKRIGGIDMDKSENVSKAKHIIDMLDMTEKKGEEEYLWVRLGDIGEYEDYGDDFQALAGYLREFGIKEIDRWIEKGFEASGFTGHNYVSLYWGDDEGNFSSKLAQREKIQLEKLLEG